MVPLWSGLLNGSKNASFHCENLTGDCSIGRFAYDDPAVLPMYQIRRRKELSLSFF